MSLDIVQHLYLELKNLRIWDPERGFITFTNPLPRVELPLVSDPDNSVMIEAGDYLLPISLHDDPHESHWRLHIGKRQFILTPGLRRAYYVETAAVSHRDDEIKGEYPIRAVFDLIAG